MSPRAIEREARRLLRKRGASDFRVIRGGKHHRLRYRWGGGQHSLTLPSTPHGQRWVANMRADINRSTRGDGSDE